MVKNLRYFCTLLLMMVASVTWAGSVDDVLTSADFTATNNNYSSFTGVKKTSDAVYAGNSAKYTTGAIQMRSKDSNSGIVSTTSGGKITKVTITWDTNTVDGRNLQVYGSNTAYSAASDLYGDNSGTLLGTLNAGNNETEVEVSGDYAYVGIRSASGALYLTKVTFTWDDGKNDNLADPEFSFGDTNSFEVDQNADGTFPAFQAPTLSYADGFDGTVEYSSSNTDVATVNKQTGDVTIVGVGTAKIMAHAEATETYKAGHASYTLKVNMYIDPTVGTKENPYTVAQAIAFIETLGTSTSSEVYVNGIISQIDEVSTEHGNATYWISDDGGTTTQMEVYRGKYLEGENFTSADQIAVGDEVIVYGTLKKYYETPEFNQGNYLVDLKHNDVPVLADAELSYPVEAYTATIGGENEFPVLANPNGLAVTYTSSNESVATVDAEGNINLVGAGETTITATSEETDAFKAGEASYVLTVEEQQVPGEGVQYQLITSTDEITSGKYLIVSATQDGTNVAFNGSLETLDAAFNNQTVEIVNKTITTDKAIYFNIDVENGTLQSASGKYISIYTYVNGLKQSDDPTDFINSFAINEGGDAKISVIVDNKGEEAEMTLRFNYAKDQLRFRYFKSGQQPIYLYKAVGEVEEETIPVTIGSTGYATLYYGASNLIVPEGVQASTYTVTEGQLQASKVYTANKVIPAGTGVVLEAAEGTYTFTATSEVAEAADANMLKGSDGGYQDKTEGYKYYILSYDKQGQNPGFYFQYEGGTKVDNAPHKAYLAVPAPVAGEAKFFTFGGETGINAVEAGKTNGVVYNLQGQRVENAQKGIFIMNGKKVVR